MPKVVYFHAKNTGKRGWTSVQTPGGELILFNSLLNTEFKTHMRVKTVTQKSVQTQAKKSNMDSSEKAGKRNMKT